MKSTFTSLFPERNQFMKGEIDIAGPAGPGSSPLYVHPAPSLRVPVTAANRTLLRWLRAAELSDWEAGHTCFRKCSPANPAPLQNHRT
jgi:hypothetical protein